MDDGVSNAADTHVLMLSPALPTLNCTLIGNDEFSTFHAKVVPILL